MALTRKMLKALGIEDDKIEQIIDAHTETVDGLKDKLTKAEADAAKLTDVQKELDGLKAGGDYKKKFEDEHKAFEDYKKDISAKETRAAKEKAVRGYLESKSIKGANLDIGERSQEELDAMSDADYYKATYAQKKG